MLREIETVPPFFFPENSYGLRGIPKNSKYIYKIESLIGQFYCFLQRDIFILRCCREFKCLHIFFWSTFLDLVMGNSSKLVDHLPT